MNKTLPLITITGVPNTGKSTLFNRIIGKRKALIHSQPGMTRDIYKKTFTLNDRTFFIQDSGGFFVGDNLIYEEINKRIFREAKRSDLIIFLFDGKREILGYEKELYLNIKKINDNIIPVINKVDNPGTYILPSSYYSLKLNYVEISAEHNKGIDELFDKIEEKFVSYNKKSDSENDSLKTRISIVGKPNVGKSSIVNKILNDDYVIVSSIPGTTRDSVDLEFKRNNKVFIIVDNAGIRKLQKIKEDTETAAVIRAGKDIKNSDIIVFVLDLSKKIDKNDYFIAQKILKSAKPVVVACNKWDLVSNKDNSLSILSKFKQNLNFFYFAPFITLSAKTGKNILNLIDKTEFINNKIQNRIKTSNLNFMIQEILKEKKLLTENNKKFNPKYLSIESYRPFFIRFYTSSKSRLKQSHELYLKRKISDVLDLEGIPIFFNISSK